MKDKVGITAPVVFVSGKGGVGKSMWAASVATRLARAGKRVLLVEFGETSFFGYFYSQPVSMQPLKIEPNLHVAIWNGATCLHDYIRHLVKIDRLADLFFENKVMKALIRGAPALKELAILGKATSGVRNYGPDLDYDHIVFDSYATGHFLALLRAPVGMYEAIKFGPMGDQSKAIIATLKDPQAVEYHLVSLLEELPVSETLELHEQLSSEFSNNIKLIANKSLRYIESADPHSNEFEKSMHENIQKQNMAWDRLQGKVKVDAEIPFIFENQALSLIDEFCEYVEA